jgi:hypothetical protein
MLELDAGDADDGVLITRRKVRRVYPSVPHARVDHTGRQDLQGAEEAGEVRDRRPEGSFGTSAQVDPLITRTSIVGLVCKRAA